MNVNYKSTNFKQALLLEDENETLVLKEGDLIEVITDKTDFNETYTGKFLFNGKERVIVGDENIPIEYIVEIKEVK